MATPKVDDQFWFDYSGNLVSNATETYDKQAARFQTLVTWLWGIYTASAAVGFALATKELDTLTTCSIAATSLVLIIAYWSATWVQAPVLSRFDPRSPPEIMQAYVHAIEMKRFRLKATQYISAIAGLMVAFSLVAASLTKPPVTTDMQAIVTSTPNGQFLAITGKVKDCDGPLIVVAQPVSSNGVAASQPFVFAPQKADGLIQTAFLITNPAPRYIVTLEWSNRGADKVTISKTVLDPGWGKKTL